jgi:hypothetical protein
MRPEVLRFLHDRGCIAHALNTTTLEVNRPHSLPRHESHDVIAMLEEYQAWRPERGFRVAFE